MFNLIKAIFISVLFSSAAMADGHGHGRGHGWGHHHHHDEHVIVEHVYYPERVIHAPAPVPRYQSYDQRSAQGLVGGAVGSAIGYEMSKGDPLGAGLGAAAGAWIGNGIAR